MLSIPPATTMSCVPAVAFATHRNNSNITHVVVTTLVATVNE